MNRFIFIICLIGLISFFNLQGKSQNDILYKKDGSSIGCKIREIKLDIITYTRPELKRSPIYEVKRNDAYRILYKNGIEDILDVEFYKMVKKNRHISDSIWVRQDTARMRHDSFGYSMVYVVFNSGYSSQYFPFYINGQYICTIKNQSRLEYKMFSEGEFEVFRKYRNKIGPVKKVLFQHGNKYAISIKMNDEQILDPNNRFSMTIYESEEDVKEFIKKEYNGFKPFKSLDLHIIEK